MLFLNTLSGAAGDNPVIIFGSIIIVAGLYIQAYLNRPRMAANIMVFAFWMVLTLIVSNDGVVGSAVFWMVAVSPGAILVAGARSGLIWYLVCLITIWIIALMQYGERLGTLSEHSALIASQLGQDQVLFFATEVSFVMTILVVVTLVFWRAQRRIEENLRDAVSALESEVHSRTLAETEARQSASAKSAFLAAMSHELRTPLNGVLGASRLLLESPTEADRKTYIEVIAQSGEILLETINNVLDLTSFESGNVQLECVATDLRKLVNETVSPLRFQAQKKNLTLISQIAESVPAYVMLDPIRIRQIIINLLGNSIKFTEQGEIRLDIELLHERLLFSITDTGIGVSKEEQATLFEPYVRTKRTIVDGYIGSGLGLSIVKTLVSAMDGEIDLQSAKGEGSTFTVSLPYQPAENEAAPQDATLEPILSALEVLVVDDNAVNRLVLSRLLEKDNHQVIAVEDGQKAIDYLISHDIDVVMMDLQMPMLDGLSATQQIRNLPGKKKHVPVIAITANTMIKKPNSELAAEFDGLVAKPFQYEQLVEELKRVLPVKI